MAQIINTNIASLNAQRNLNTSQSDLAVSLQRLSSGLRINSAKADAAGDRNRYGSRDATETDVIRLDRRTSEGDQVGDISSIER